MNAIFVLIPSSGSSGGGGSVTISIVGMFKASFVEVIENSVEMTALCVTESDLICSGVVVITEVELLCDDIVVNIGHSLVAG